MAVNHKSFRVPVDDSHFDMTSFFPSFFTYLFFFFLNIPECFRVELVWSSHQVAQATATEWKRRDFWHGLGVVGVQMSYALEQDIPLQAALLV